VNAAEENRECGLEKPSEVIKTRYEIDLDLSERIGWRESEEPRRFLTSSQLADLWMNRLLEQLHPNTET
jgi:hypothetical protein